MRLWSASLITLTALATAWVGPDTAQASPLPSTAATVETSVAPTTAGESASPPPPPSKRRDRVRSLEAQVVGMTQLLPRPGLGGDLALSVGFPHFQARIGVLVVGVPPFRLGQGELANVVQAGTLDLCAAKPVLHHQIRMCVGGQAGAMAHRWKGYERPGRRMTGWVAGTLKGDYQIKLTDHFGVIGTVGVVLPVVGPSFGGQDAIGTPVPLVFPGPMAGFLSLGTTYRW